VKNRLFVGHPRAGRRAAIIYTLTLNCQVHDIGPAAYLSDVLRILPKSSSSPEAIRQLQPRRLVKLGLEGQCRTLTLLVRTALHGPAQLLHAAGFRVRILSSTCDPGNLMDERLKYKR